jgi:hypothetical protein
VIAIYMPWRVRRAPADVTRMVRAAPAAPAPLTVAADVTKSPRRGTVIDP